MFFVILVVLVVVGGVGLIGVLALNRQSVIGVAPVPGSEGVEGDHWHSAYVINNCGEDLPFINTQAGSDGIHTHGDGLVHVHPSNATAAGSNAKVGKFLKAAGADLTDDTYTPPPASVDENGTQIAEDETVLAEADGCDGSPATLKLAYWEDAYQTEPGEPDVVLTEDLADFVFEKNHGMFTLALVAEGEEITPPPPDRIASLARTNDQEYTPPEGFGGAVVPEEGPTATGGFPVPNPGSNPSPQDGPVESVPDVTNKDDDDS